MKTLLLAAIALAASVRIAAQTEKVSLSSPTAFDVTFTGSVPEYLNNPPSGTTGYLPDFSWSQYQAGIVGGFAIDQIDVGNFLFNDNSTEITWDRAQLNTAGSFGYSFDGTTLVSGDDLSYNASPGWGGTIMYNVTGDGSNWTYSIELSGSGPAMNPPSDPPISPIFLGVPDACATLSLLIMSLAMIGGCPLLEPQK